MNNQLLSNPLDSNCRYCFNDCIKNVSICKCKGILCKDCFDEELKLTKKRNKKLECTVCKTSYIHMPSVDSVYIKCMTCKEFVSPTKNIMCYNIPNKNIIFNIIYIFITALYNIWVALYIINHVKKITVIGYWITVIDSMSFIITPAAYFISKKYSDNKFPYFLLSILIIYIIRSSIILFIVNWSNLSNLTMLIVIYGILWVVFLILYFIYKIIYRIQNLHNEVLNKEGLYIIL